MLGATAKFEGLDNIVSALEYAGTHFDKSSAMVPAVRAFGYGIVDNWRKGGARVGGWKPLKEYTINERIARGYGAGPTLQQSGGLRQGAIVPFSSWPDAQTRFNTIIPPTPGRSKPRNIRGMSRTDQADISELDTMQSGPTTVISGVHPRTFFASISGAKAMNQTGGNIPSVSRWAGFSGLAARPFWFFDTQMLDEGAQGIVDLFMFQSFKNLPLVTGLPSGLSYKRAITYGN